MKTHHRPIIKTFSFSNRIIRIWLTILIGLGGLVFGQNSQKLPAPNSERGFSAAGKFQENVNLFSGSVNISIPIATLRISDEFAFSLGLVYDSNVWHVGPGEPHDRTSELRPSPFRTFNSLDPSAGAYSWNVSPGWLLHPGRLIEVDPSTSEGAHFIYFGSDNSSIPLYDSLHGDQTPSPNTYYSRDGSYLKFESEGGPTGNLTTPKGITTRFVQGWFDFTEDPYGNRVTKVMVFPEDQFDEVIMIFRENRYNREIKVGLAPSYGDACPGCPSPDVRFNPGMGLVNWVEYHTPGTKANGDPNTAKILFGREQFPIFQLDLPAFCDPEDPTYDQDACIDWLRDADLGVQIPAVCDGADPAYDEDLCFRWQIDNDRAHGFWRRHLAEVPPFQQCVPDACWGRIDDLLIFASVAPLNKITFPDGSEYEFEYGKMSEVDGGPPGHYAGGLSEITLPTGGIITYTWGPYRVPDNRTLIEREDDPYYGRHYWAPHMGVISKKKWDLDGLNEDGEQVYVEIEEIRYRRGIVDDGNWDGNTNPYLDEASINHASVDRDIYVVETSPLGNDTVHYFRTPAKAWDYGLPFIRQGVIHNAFPSRGMGDIRQAYLSREIFSGPAIKANGEKGDLKRQTFVAFERDIKAANENFRDPLNARMFYIRELYFDDLNGSVPHFKDTYFSDFDGLGHYRKVTKGGSWSGTKTRTINYNPTSGSYVVYESDQGGDDEHTFKAGDGHTFANPPNAADPSRQYPTHWILDTYDAITKESGGQISKKEVTFNHATGSVGRVRTLTHFGETQAANDILEVMVYDARGKLTDLWTYGGDIQADPLIDNGLPGTATNPVALGTMVLADLTPEYHRHMDNDYTNGVFKTFEKDPVTGQNLLLHSQVEIEMHTGLVTSTAGADGVTTVFGYDVMLRETSMKHAGNAAVRTVFNPPTSSRGFKIEVNQGTIENFTIQNGFGTEIQSAHQYPTRPGQSEADSLAKINLKYENGVLTQLTHPFWPDDTNRGLTKFENHDFRGLPTRVLAADGLASRSEISGERVQRKFNKRGTIFDGLSDVSQVEIPITQLFDTLGRLIQVSQTLDNANDVAKTTYSYDVNDKLVQVNQEGAGSQSPQIRSFTFDNRGFLIGETHPENGTSVYSGYDSRGKFKTYTNGAANLNHAYTQWGAITSISEPDPDNPGQLRLLIDHSYASANQSPTNKSAGKLYQTRRFNYLPSSPQPLVVTQTFYYEDAEAGIATGNLSATRMRTSHGLHFESSFTYDNKLDLTAIAYPRMTFPGLTANLQRNLFGQDSETTQVFQYQRGYLTDVQNVLASNFEYHPHPRFFKKVSHANGYSDEILQANNDMARPTSIFTKKPNGTNLWASGAMHYDGSSNLIKIGLDRFRYDRGGRLVEAEVGGQSRSYKYDRFGNLKKMGDRSWAVSATTNQLTGAGIVYDGRGNLKEIDGQSYRYDALDRVQRSFPAGQAGQNLLYVYDSQDYRVAIIEPNGRESWFVRNVSGQLLKTYGRNSKTQKLKPKEEYIYGNRLLAANIYDAKGDFKTRHHFHLDHLGSIRKITNSEGNLVASHDYWPYGEEMTQPNPGERLQFTGHERDSETQNYMLARYHLSHFGRFTTVDPILGNSEVPQSWNRYAYANNNPVNIIDPEGQSGVPVVDKIAPAASAASIYQFYKDLRALNSNKPLQQKPFERFVTGAGSAYGLVKASFKDSIGKAGAKELRRFAMGLRKSSPWFKNVSVLRAAQFGRLLGRFVHVLSAFTTGWELGTAFDQAFPRVGDFIGEAIISFVYTDFRDNHHFTKQNAKRLRAVFEATEALFLEGEEQCQCSLERNAENFEQLLEDSDAIRAELGLSQEAWEEYIKWLKSFLDKRGK